MRAPSFWTGDRSEGFATYPASRTPAERLSYLLQFATFAPSFPGGPEHAEHDAPPVRFWVHDDAIDVVVEQGERHAVMSAGAAIHHVVVACNAFGETALVEETPRATTVARLTLDAFSSPDRDAQQLLVAAARRRELPDVFRSTMVPAASIRALVNECRRERTALRVVVGDERDEIVSFAPTPPGTSERALLDGSPLLFAVTTQADDPADWLAAGRSMSAVSLRAYERGLALSLLYDPHEGALLDRVRDLLRTERTPQAIVRAGFYDSPSVSAPERVAPASSLV